MLIAMFQRYCPKSNNLQVVINMVKRNLCKESAVLDTMPFYLYKLQDEPAKQTILIRKDALTFYENLYVIRTIENSITELLLKGFVRSPLHSSAGQEAVAVGLNAVFRKQDSYITSYRSRGWVYLLGVDPVSIIGEMVGKKCGSAEGKGGSMHLYYSDRYYGGQGIVGAQIPLGTGIALAKQYTGSDGVCVAFYGDGSANQGQVFESFNMAKLWNLPCIFVCENNKYGKFTSMECSSASTKYYTRGDYIPGIWADGMDVLSVREVGKYALNYCLSGRGPIIIEVDTYMYDSNAIIDPTINFRPEEEVEEVRRNRDPIMSFQKKILDANLVTEKELNDIETKIKQTIKRAEEFVVNDTEPGIEKLVENIYSKNLEGKVRYALPEKFL